MRKLVIVAAAVGLSIASVAYSAAQPSINDKLIKDVSSGSIPAVQQDLAKGADVNAVVGQYCSNPLDSAAEKGDLAMIRFLLDHGAKVNAVHKDCFTALTDAAFNGHADVVRLLIERGADPGLPDGFTNTPLMKTASAGDADVARILLDHGADVNAKDQFGGTALMNAVVSDKMDAALVLIGHGADVNGKGVLEASSRNPDMLALLRAHGATGTTLEEQIAHDKITGDASKGDLTAVQRDLANGADINAKDQYFHETPLIWAIEQHHDDVARFLIEHGADVNMLDAAGRSPLAMAVTDGNAGLVRELLAHGATPNAKLIDWARTFQPQMLAILQPAPAPAQASASAAATDGLPSWVTGRWRGPGPYVAYEDLAEENDIILSGPYSDQESCDRDAAALEHRIDLRVSAAAGFSCENFSESSQAAELKPEDRKYLADLISRERHSSENTPQGTQTMATFAFVNEMNSRVTIALDGAFKCSLDQKVEGAESRCTVDFDGSSPHTFSYTTETGRKASSAYSPGQALKETCRVNEATVDDCQNDSF